MSHLEQSKVVAGPEKWSLGEGEQPFRARHGSIHLTDTLLAIQEKRGALFMLDMSRYLIEKWNLQSDQLEDQSDEIRDLVAKLLKS